MNGPDLADLLRSAPGALGSLVSLLWLKETLWLRRVILFIGGWTFAAGAQGQVSKWTHLEPGFVLGFMLGVGSMALFAKVIESWQSINFGRIATDAVRKWLGLAPSTTKPAPLGRQEGF